MSADSMNAAIASVQMRYYTVWQMLLGTIIGGPLAGGYLISKNHSVFGTPRRSGLVMVISCLLLIGLLSIGLLIPHRGSNTGHALVVTFGYNTYARWQFAAPIEALKNQGGRPYSWWRVVGISIAVLAGIFILVAMLAVVLPDRVFQG